MSLRTKSQFPNTTPSSDIQKVSNGPSAAYFMLPLPNTELRNYLDENKTISKLNSHLQTPHLQNRSWWDAGLGPLA